MTLLRTLLLLILACSSLPGAAQLKYISIISDEKDESGLRSGHEFNTLPFWDDFSYAGEPNPEFWQNSEAVFINAGLSYDPPSLYVASFDGLDANGNPRGSGSTEGAADSLTSRPFDLSLYSAADNIYLSFFYQWAGTGDQPDAQDSLVLFFRNDVGEWINVWPATASELDRTGEFRQAVIPVLDDSWLHENFQFRFQSYGRLSGAFDIWNLDYIYMNTGRDPFDRSFPDRAISEPLTGFLGGYRQVPYTHLSADQLTNPSFRLKNLVISATNQNKAYNYYFNYEINVTDTLGNTTSYTNSTFVEPLESPIASSTSEEVIIREPFPGFTGNEAADSANVRLEIILDAEDNVPIAEGGDYNPSKYAPVDFQENDTLRQEYILADVYGYDDGAAEIGAGLNTAGDRLAYQYTLRTEDALITGMEIHFPFTGSSPDGKQLELTVWQDDGGLPGPVIFRQVVNARQAAERNGFIRYEFARPVLVSGTFYIGYRQNSPGSLAIGLDQNTSSGDRMFFNLGELWETNTLVQGSLMLRPVFNRVLDVITGIDDELGESVRPYPNPSANGIFFLNTLDPVSVTDLAGRNIPFERIIEGGRTMIRLNTPARGVYLVQTATRSWRLIIP